MNILEKIKEECDKHKDCNFCKLNDGEKCLSALYAKIASEIEKRLEDGETT